MKIDIITDVGQPVELFGIKGIYLSALGIILCINLLLCFIIFTASPYFLINILVISITLILPIIVLVQLNNKGEKMIDTYIAKLTLPRYIINNRPPKDILCN